MSVYKRKPESFNEMLAPYSREIRTIALGLRRMIREALPESEEKIYGGLMVAQALYGIGGPAKVICGIQPDKIQCRLFLHNVADLKPPGIKIEGTGKHARHVKVVKLNTENKTALSQLVAEAFNRSGMAKR
ncbi:MAG TPA: hypothetical protein VI546_01470 [candidate division Zixibacteria bacterium]|nr:hypothetical protein [candidate division Zixibacteria bacterium]